MRTLYDVQMLLKRFGVYVYVGKRLWDIELMQIELKSLNEEGLVSDEVYIPAALVLRQEHRIEEEKERRTKLEND
ncbi:YqgQ family protein [Carnobacterium gallinarum]|uniref:YqgQ family protein n=1 Tax=Carnobacterium gallinarum TaxID=2749 RepID=UPI0005577942|nr:YqgQ family protein [Carnobacterium gallinarum]